MTTYTSTDARPYTPPAADETAVFGIYLAKRQSPIYVNRDKTHRPKHRRAGWVRRTLWGAK